MRKHERFARLRVDGSKAGSLANEQQVMVGAKTGENRGDLTLEAPVGSRQYFEQSLPT